MKKRKKKPTKLAIIDVKFEELHGQPVQIKRYQATTKGRRRIKMTTSSRKYKRAPLSIGELRSEGFVK